jgi:hypothetical protein
MALSNANLDMLAGGVLAYWSHEFAHVLVAIALGVPIVNVRWRWHGLSIRRRDVGGRRGRAVTAAGMLANLWLGFFALTHGDPWGGFANWFMVGATQVWPWKYSDLRRLMTNDYHREG